MNRNTNFFGRIGRASASHPWITFATWVVVAAVILVVGANTSAFDPDADFTVGVESQTAQQIQDDAFGETTGSQELLVIQSQTFEVSDPEFQEVVDGMIANLTPFENDIVQVIRYYDAPDLPEMQHLVSADGHTLLVPIHLAGEWDEYDSRWPELEAVIDQSTPPSFFIGAVGDISSGEISTIYEEDLAKEIQVGLPAALLVMLVVFGALVAAGLPLILGIVTILIGTGLVQILGGQLYMSDIALTMVSMIGLAVGVDYSLMMVERYRDERNRGVTKLDAIELASATAGKAVFFSGMTTVLALFGVFFVPMAEFQGMGLAMAVAVGVAVVAALTLLPTFVAIVGNWINFPRMAKIRRWRDQDQRGLAPQPTNERLGLWGRIASVVVAHPAISGALVTGLLIAAAIPALTIQLGQPSAFDLPASQYVTSYRIMAREFSAGEETPLEIVLTGSAATEENGQRVQSILATDDLYGDSVVTTSDDNSVLVITVPLRVDNSSAEAQEAVKTLREDTIQAIAGSDGYVGGVPGFVYDFNEILLDSLPKVLLFVLSLSFLVVMLAFRSITVPALSVALNLLSVGAAYGAVVAVFQHGFLADQLGMTTVDTIVNWLPIMLFCILFGLSMDYHVFVLSRIREAWDRTHDVDESIVEGVNHTGKIITGAAVIMIAVFGSFALGRSSEMQQVGLGLAIAVFLDVTLIRSILLPAGLKLLGKNAWWWPTALAWVPKINVEGTPAAPQTAPQGD